MIRAVATTASPAAALRLFAVLVLLFFALPLTANPSRRPAEALEQGRTAYDRGDYARAIATLTPLLYPAIELSTEDEVVSAHRLLALSYFFVNRQKDAEAEVTSLLALRPSYALDPIVDPPVAVSFFEDVRRHQGERLKAVQQREREERERISKERELERVRERARAERVYVDRTVETHSRAIAMLPFGIGQLQNGQRQKAIAFGVAEGVFALASLAGYLAITFNYPYRHFEPSEKTTAIGLQTLQLGAGGLFWLTAAWGIIDAQVYFKRQIVRDLRENVAPKRTLSIVPMPAGVGLKGTF